MEINIQDLVQSIKHDGIEEAKKEANAVVDAARLQAQEIIEAAKKEAAKILEAEVSKTMSGEALARIIIAALNGDDPAKYTVEINAVSDSLKNGLAKELEKGLELKPVKGASIKIALKDGTGYYDLSDEEIVNLLKPFLGALKF